MGLYVGLDIRVAAPDGTIQVQTQRIDLTVCPAVGDYGAEAELAMATVDRLVAEAQAEVRERMQDWAQALQAQVGPPK